AAPTPPPQTAQPAAVPVPPPQTPPPQTAQPAPVPVPPPQTPPAQTAQPAPVPVPPPPTAAQHPPLGSDQVQLNFDNAELYDFVNQIADTAWITPIIIDAIVKRSANIHSAAPLPKDDGFPLVNLILTPNNPALVAQRNVE